tara:strand:+ start:240 stop:416 length:177 start_codon:yes stop_codon:yes gene_type:complete
MRYIVSFELELEDQPDDCELQAAIDCADSLGADLGCELSEYDRGQTVCLKPKKIEEDN